MQITSDIELSGAGCTTAITPNQLVQSSSENDIFSYESKRIENGRYLYSQFICNNKQTDRRRNYSGHAILSDALDLADFDFRTPLPTNLRKRQVVSPCWAWRLSSKTRGINQALSNAYLKSQGLYELRNGWIKFHHS